MTIISALAGAATATDIAKTNTATVIIFAILLINLITSF
jgi:hypothetical protein